MGGGGAPTGTMWGPAQTPAGRNAMKRRVRRGRTEGKGALYSAASLIQSGRQPALPQAHCVDPSFLHSWEELGLGRSGLVLGSQFPVSLEHDGHNGGWGLRPKSPTPPLRPVHPILILGPWSYQHLLLTLKPSQQQQVAWKRTLDLHSPHPSLLQAQHTI